jgi:hypothetical protein
VRDFNEGQIQQKKTQITEILEKINQLKKLFIDINYKNIQSRYEELMKLQKDEKEIDSQIMNYQNKKNQILQQELLLNQKKQQLAHVQQTLLSTQNDQEKQVQLVQEYS